MSAYVVSNETINKIVCLLQYDQNGKWLLNHLAQSEGLTFQSDKDFEQFARAIFLLNVQAVNHRYGEIDSGTTTLKGFQYSVLPNVTKIEGYKALKCLIYQCSEGDVPETDLYKTLSLIASNWAEDIVSSLDAYEKASWG